MNTNHFWAVRHYAEASVQHWSDARQRSWDIDRLAILEDAGWIVIRVSAEMLRRPGAIIDRVRTKLREAGCPI
jgi:very-short-patch-repair endonuclease